MNIGKTIENNKEEARGWNIIISRNLSCKIFARNTATALAVATQIFDQQMFEMLETKQTTTISNRAEAIVKHL